MTNSRKYTWISLLVLMALAFALLFAFAVAPAQANAEPETHTHDDVTFTAWTSTTSLPGSAGSYYLTADVTLSGTWTMPSGGVSICLNGHGIKAPNDARVITVNGGTLNLYDCGDATHYFDVDGGKAVNVNDVSGANSFSGGYITGGVGKGGLAQSSVYWSEGGGILVWSGTFNMYGGTILGNSASHGGGVEVVNASMNMYDGAIIYNTCGEGGAGINLRSQSGNTVTLNMYGGSVSYNKGTSIDQSYCYGNRYLNLYGGTVSHNTGSGVWITNATVNGDPVIEENGGWGMLFAGTCSLAGSPVIRNNTSGNVYVNNNDKITIAGALDVEPIGVTMKNNTGVFTSGWSNYMMMDPTDVFFSDKADYHVELAEGEAVIAAGGIVTVDNLQGTVKNILLQDIETVGDLKAAAATEFGVTEDQYKLTYNDVDLLDGTTLSSNGIDGGETVAIVPLSGDELKTLTLDPSVTSTATTNAQGYYTAISQGDTVTITYASTQNSGFSDAVFTTAFDEEYFHLTSFAVDDTYYTLFNDYGREVGGIYTPMTLAQHIADHNAALDAGEEPYTGRLSFFLTYKDTLFDGQGALSDHFITVTYTAVKAVPAGTDVSFGFDMSLGGMFTNAAYDDDILLHIIDKDGATVDDKMVTLILKSITEVSIVEGQSIDLDGTIDTDDIELTWTEPEFETTNPYIADGGEVTYTFYTLVDNNYVRVEDGNGQPILPTEVGDYYVKATLSETDHYIGYETEGYVAITVKGLTEVAVIEDQSILLPIDTDDIELTWTEPEFETTNPYIADGGEVTYTFYTLVDNNYVRVEDGNGQPILPTEVGDYYVKATLSETDHYRGYTTDDYVAITVKSNTQLEIPAKQELVFHRFGSEYFVSAEDLTVNWTLPVFDPEEENPYIADGGSVTLTFYTKVGNEYVRVEDGNGMPVVPNAVGDYYVKATLIGTEHYVASETDYVPFSVARRKVAVPELKLYAGEASATATYAAHQLNITLEADYGTTFTLKEIVNNEEAAYTLPELNGLNIEDLVYNYGTMQGIALNTYDTNFFLDQPLTVGTYKLFIQPRFAQYIEFDADPSVEKIVVTVIVNKVKVTAPTETTETYTYDGTEQTYDFATDGDTAYFTVTNDKRTNAGGQQVSVVLDDKTNYEWAAGGVEDLSFTFTINKAPVTEPTETTLTYTYTGEEQTYDFATDGDTAYFTVTNDKRTNAGEQTVTVSLKDSDNYEWTTGGIDAKPFTFTIAPKALTVKTFIGGETEVELTYGDAAPAANALTFTVEGAVSDEEEEDIRAILEVTSANAYAQFADVGEYVYTTSIKANEELSANYTIETTETATITVVAKALTIGVSYEGGKATFSVEGIVNDDEVPLVYSVDGTDLTGNVYTAVAADLEKATITATVTPDDENYAADSLALLAVKSVTFRAIGEFASVEVPETQYIFAGYLATEPDEDPSYSNHVFLHWYITEEAVAYDFATAVTDSITLTAAWEKTVYAYKFRALNAGAEYTSNTYRYLKWENGAFALADSLTSFEFTNGTAIPTVGTVGDFRLDHWVKAVKVNDEYTYTTVKNFEATVSVEVNADAYYIAVMTLDLGRGDVNGDGTVTAEDIIMMKKFLVGVKYQTFTNSAAVWAKVGETIPANTYLYTFLWDANGDGYKDTRDVLTERMALATGHGYEIISDATVDDVYYSKQILVKVAYVDSYEALGEALFDGQIVVLTADIELEDGELFETEGSIYIDLGSKTLSVTTYEVSSASTVTLKNGVLDVETSFTVSGSSVTFENVTDEVGESIVVTKETSVTLD